MKYAVNLFRSLRIFQVLVLLLFMLSLISCANIQEQWKKLTPDEQARIIMDQFQEQLTGLFDSTKAYVVLNAPKYDEKWKKEIAPAFDVANKGLAAAQKLAKDGNYTPEKVYLEVQPFINAVKKLIISIGAPTTMKTIKKP